MLTLQAGSFHSDSGLDKFEIILFGLSFQTHALRQHRVASGESFWVRQVFFPCCFHMR